MRTPRSSARPTARSSALEHNLARLADDHARARSFAAALADSPRVSVDLPGVETNIVLARISGATSRPRRWSTN